MKIDRTAMTATIKEGTFPIRIGEDGILRWVINPTPGSRAPTAEEHKAALDEINALTAKLRGGSK